MSSQGDIVQMEPKKKRAKRGEREVKVDYTSKLSYCILIFILSMLTTKEAVQTCILSKRWKHLWKYLPNLVTRNTRVRKDEFFERFVSRFLVDRDDDSNLTNVDIEHHWTHPHLLGEYGNVHPQLLDKVTKYAVKHKVQQLKISSYVKEGAPLLVPFRGSNSKIPCETLEYLNLSFCQDIGAALFPNTLECCPELIECRLTRVIFWSMDEKGCVKPFSGCKKMTTLSIDYCTLDIANCLVVTGYKLTNLSIRYKHSDPFKLQMCTPNLTSFAYVGCVTPDTNSLLFKHNLNFLEEVRMEVWCSSVTSDVAQTLWSWLRKYTNVHSLALSSAAIEILSTIRDFPPERLNLGSLMSFTVKLDYKLPYQLSDVLNYLLQDSPPVAVIIS